MKSRYNFTAQFVGGAVLLARRARTIEALPAPSPLDWAEHRSLVVGAVQQSAAAIEAELNAVVEHGPSHHLGSNGTDTGAREFLEPLVEIIDGIKGPLDRWAAVLHVLRKSPVLKANGLGKMPSCLSRFGTNSCTIARASTGRHGDAFWRDLRRVAFDRLLLLAKV